MKTEEMQVIKQPIPDKLVVLTFDDASLSHATFVAPILKEYGFGATFFICEFPARTGDKPCPGFEDKEAYMTWEQIRELHLSGFEIGNHTLNHSHVNRITPEALAKEIDEIDIRCQNYGIPKPVTFAYPAYSTTPEALTVLREKGFLWARTGGGIYDPLKHHPLLIPSSSPSLKKDLDAFAKTVNEAKDGKIPVLVFHGVPDNAHSWVSMDQEAFSAYMKYLHDNNFTAIAMKDLGKYIDAEKAEKFHSTHTA